MKPQSATRNRYVRSIRAYAFMVSIFASAPSLAWLHPLESPEHRCYEVIAEQPEYQPLKGRFLKAGGDSGPSFLRYSNREKISDTDRPLVAAIVGEFEQCRNTAMSWRRANLPAEAYAYMDSSFSTYLLLVADLYEGKITYGEFWRKRDEASRDDGAAASRFSQADQARRNQQAENQAAEEQARTQALSNALRGLASPQPAYAPPVYTRCSFLGGVMNCYSR